MHTTILPKYPTHPGTLIKDELTEMENITQKELASQLGVTASFLSEVINGKRSINASLAIGLEKIFGIPAEYWLRFQSQYDLDLLRLSPPDQKVQFRYKKELAI